MKVIYSILLFLLPLSLFGQVNSHYWSHQYGSKGLLLNGSVIASVNDETAIFYNPGSMALTDDFGISLSLITPTYSLFRTTDFLGEGTSFSDQGLGLSPGLVAAMFKPFGTDKVVLGLTTFTRYRSEIGVEDRVVKNVEQNPDQIFLGDIDFNDVKDKCSYITPVPGGIGPMTIAMLVKQIVESSEMTLLNNL